MSMETNPLVSVVIPTYKRDFSLLAQAVESVLAQTYAPLEVIVVSDNPPDNDFARALPGQMQKFPEVRFCQLKQNGGAPVARNTGIRMAKGEFIAFLDDDDLWLPQKLEKQMPLFADQRVGLVYCRGYQIEGDDRTPKGDYSNARWGFHVSADFDSLLRRDYIGTTTQAVVRRSCFDDCGFFDETLKARQDFDRWLSITKHYKAVGVDEPLFLFRVHAGERITSDDARALKANAAVYQKYQADYRRNPQARMAYHYNRAFLLRRSGRMLPALCATLCSILAAPRAFVRKYRSYRGDAM